MTYIYREISEKAFHDAFYDMDRNDNFTVAGRRALFEYLENLAEEIDTPLKLDVIALCCDYAEYKDIAEYNADYATDHESWDAVEDETSVIRIPHSDGAIVQAH